MSHYEGHVNHEGTYKRRSTITVPGASPRLQGLSYRNVVQTRRGGGGPAPYEQVIPTSWNIKQKALRDEPNHFNTLRRIHRGGLYQQSADTTKFQLPDEFRYLQHHMSVDKYMKGYNSEYDTTKEESWTKVPTETETRIHHYKYFIGQRVYNPNLKVTHASTKLKFQRKVPGSYRDAHPRVPTKQYAQTSRTHKENERERERERDIDRDIESRIGKRSVHMINANYPGTNPRGHNHYSVEQERQSELNDKWGVSVDHTHANRTFRAPSHGMRGDGSYAGYPYINQEMPEIPRLRKYEAFADDEKDSMKFIQRVEETDPAHIDDALQEMMQLFRLGDLFKDESAIVELVKQNYSELLTLYLLKTRNTPTYPLPTDDVMKFLDHCGFLNDTCKESDLEKHFKARVFDGGCTWTEFLIALLFTFAKSSASWKGGENEISLTDKWSLFVEALFEKEPFCGYTKLLKEYFDQENVQKCLAKFSSSLYTLFENQKKASVGLGWEEISEMFSFLKPNKDNQTNPLQTAFVLAANRTSLIAEQRFALEYPDFLLFLVCLADLRTAEEGEVGLTEERMTSCFEEFFPMMLGHFQGDAP